jgi:hypothetical protein
MDEVRLTMSEALLYVAIGGAVVGFLLGLVPLVVGIVKKKVKIGVIGLIVSTLGGALLGVFISIPAMAIFTWLILREQVVATDPIETPGEPASQETKEN